MQKIINNTKKLINEKYTEYDNYQDKIDEIVEKCPDVDFTTYREGWTVMERPDLDNLTQADNDSVGEFNGPPTLE